VSNKAPHDLAANPGPTLHFVHNNVIDHGAEAAIRQPTSIADEAIGLQTPSCPAEPVWRSFGGVGYAAVAA
jgi:hypothetical protein